ncbi:MAG: hypothetical protein MI673_06630 [Thiotrichales bacterium]|nr:hypothetical protein [Thiotrichales bacterium]
MSETRSELLRKKQELEVRLDKIKQDLATGLNPDFEEQATELENRDVLYEIQRVTGEELEGIRQKLRQLDDGEMND